jgi:hypothetical protein
MLFVLKSYQICQVGPPLSYPADGFWKNGGVCCGVGVKLFI